MEAVRQTEKRYCSLSLTTAIITGFIFILAGQKALCKGLILGTLFSILNFILIGETLPQRIAASSKKTFFLSLGSIFFRYTLLAIPIVMAIRSENYNLWAVVSGIFMVQVMILADHLRDYFFSTDSTRKNALWKN